MKSDWEKRLERRTKNIGFATRVGAFKEPTKAEMHAALVIEIDSWQKTKGTKTYSLSEEYSVAKGYGIDLKQRPSRLEMKAIDKYINTPMDAGPYIDVRPYDKESFWKKTKRFFHAEDPGLWEEFVVTILPLIAVFAFIYLFIFLRKVNQ